MRNFIDLVLSLFEDTPRLRRVVATRRFQQDYLEFVHKYRNIESTLRDFIQFRMSARPDQPFSPKDSPLTGGPPAKIGIRRCHLFHGKAVLLYQIEGSTLRLLAIVEHDGIEGKEILRFARYVASLKDNDLSDYEQPTIRKPAAPKPQMVPLTKAETDEIVALFKMLTLHPEDRHVIEKVARNDIGEFMHWARAVVNAENDERDRAIIAALGGRDLMVKRAKLWIEKTKTAKIKKEAAEPRTLARYLNIVSTLNEAPDLDRSHAARMQRARDLGFDVDDPHYHGTPRGDFDEFDPKRTADENLAYGKGIYTTRDPEAASGYSRPGSSWGNAGDDDDARPTVYKVYLRVRNPFDLDKRYPYAEIKRIFTHCFDEEELEGIEFWQEIHQEAHDYPDHQEELYRLEERLHQLEYADEHEDVDPDDYEEGTRDPEYIEDVQRALEYEKQSVQQRIEFLEQMDARAREEHKQAVETGRKASAYGRDIYKALWQNTTYYHDWRIESKLFGGESDTFEFKTQANKWLEELGYDGIRHIDKYNPSRKGKPHVVTIAFHPHQVRSVHANFDPDKADSPKLHEDDQNGGTQNLGPLSRQNRVSKVPK